MAKEKSLSPLTSTESSRIQFGFDTPGYIHSEKLAVDLNALSLLCALGGIRRLLIKWADDDEMLVPMVSGIQADGTATIAGALEVKKTQGSYKTTDSSVKEAREMDLTIELDREKIIRTLTDNGDLQNSEAWAKILDKKIKKEVLKSGLELLMRPGGRGAVLDASMLLGYPSIATFVFALLPNESINHEILMRIAKDTLQLFVASNIVSRITMAANHGARFSWIQLFGTEPLQAIRFTDYLLSSRVIYSVPREQEEIE